MFVDGRWAIENQESRTLMILLVEILTFKLARSFDAHQLNFYNERNTFQHFIIWEFMEPVSVECQTIDEHYICIQLSICYHEKFVANVLESAFIVCVRRLD